MSEHRLKLLSECPAVIYILDMPDCSPSFISETVSNQLGYGAAEFTDAPGLWVERIHPGDRDRVISELSLMAAEENGSRSLEYRVVHKDGSCRLLWDEMRAIRNGSAIAGCRIDISSRKNTIIEFEEMLRRSEARFRAAAQASLDPFFILKSVRDDNGRIADFAFEYLNSRAEEFTGKSKSSLFGQSLREFLSSAGMPELFEKYARVAETGRPLEEEFYAPALRAEWVYQQVIPVADGIAVTARDISEKKRAERSVRDAELFYRTLFEQSPAGILTVDPGTGLPIEFNDTACAQLGYTREEFAKVRIFDYEAVESAVEIKTHIAKIVLNGYDSFETKHRAKNGELRNVLVSVKTIKLPESTFFYSVYRDITDIKRAEEDIRMKANLLDAAMDSIFLTDLDGNIIYANKATCSSRGYSREELAGKNIKDIIHPETVGYVESRVKKLAEIGLMTFETSHMRKDGSCFPVEVDASVVESDGKRLILRVVRDITRRKRAEEELRQEMALTANMLAVSEATAHTTDIGKLMRDAVMCVQKIVGSDMCVSYLWDKETRVFKPAEAYGIRRELHAFFRSESVHPGSSPVKKALATRSAVIEKTGAGGEDKSGAAPGLAFRRLNEDIETCVIIPLAGKTGNLGLLIPIFLRSNPMSSSGFTERDRAVIRGIGVQVTTALEEARLYKESIDRTMVLSHKIETIQVMNEIDKSILSELDPHTMIETVMGMLAKVVPCDRATLSLVDREKGGFVYEAGFGINFFPKGTVVAFDETTTIEVLNTGRPQFVSNLKEAPDRLPLLERHFIKEGFLSHIRVPLAVKGDIIGVLAVGKKRPSGFVPEDLGTLEKLAYQISIALDNSRLIQDLKSLFLGSIRALSNAIDAKSPWTLGHSERVTRFAIEIVKKIGLGEEEVKKIELAGLLHDIGKLGTYESVLDKQGALTEQEFSLVKNHPVKGAEIIAPIKQLKEIIPLIRHHHENYDGKGYPDGIKGTEIPLLARILSVADAVDAMSADRPYRKGKPLREIVLELEKCSGTQFDPKIAATAIDLLCGDRFEYYDQQAASPRQTTPAGEISRNNELTEWFEKNRGGAMDSEFSD